MSSTYASALTWELALYPSVVGRWPLRFIAIARQLSHERGLAFVPRVHHDLVVTRKGIQEAE